MLKVEVMLKENEKNQYVPYNPSYLKIFTERRLGKIYQHVNSRTLGGVYVCNFFSYCYNFCAF